MDTKSVKRERGGVRRLAAIGVAGAFWGIVAAGCAGPGGDTRADESAAELAVERGLAFLASRQQDDGSYGSEVYRGHTAVTAFAGRALMASGSKPGSGPYGERVSRCLDYLLGCVRDDGLIVSKEPGEPPMYGHAFALIFLAECQKATPRQAVREKMERAVGLSVKSQNKEGGWRYQPDSQEADLSVTVAQLMGLEAARDAGLDVPRAAIDRAVEYIEKSQNPDGGFRYLLQGGTSGFARSAAAVAALYAAGVSEGPEIRRGLDYIAKVPPADSIGQPEVYYFYGHYHAAQAMRHTGEGQWSRWYTAVRKKLLEQQAKDGSWPDTASVDLGTAMACLTLQGKNSSS